MPVACPAIDVPPHEREVRELTGVNSSLMLPLMRTDECIGVLVLARDKSGAFGIPEHIFPFLGVALVAAQKMIVKSWLPEGRESLASKL